MVIRYDKYLVQLFPANINDTHELFNKSVIVCSLTTRVKPAGKFKLSRLITTQPHSQHESCHFVTVPQFPGTEPISTPHPLTGHYEQLTVKTTEANTVGNAVTSSHPGKSISELEPLVHGTTCPTPGRSLPSRPPLTFLIEPAFPARSRLNPRSHPCLSFLFGLPGFGWQLGGRGHLRALADNHGCLQTCPNETLMIEKMSRTSPCTRVTGVFVKQAPALREVNYCRLIRGWRKT